LIKEHKISFNPDLKVGEDKLFNFKLFQKTNNIVYINKCLYYIRTNDKSVMGSYTSNALKTNSKMYKAFEDEIDLIEDEMLKCDLKKYMDCLGYQIVRNSITSDYCHKNNPLKLKERKDLYKECKEYLKDNANKYLSAYDKYLFSVFHYPFFLMNFIMKNRIIRGGWYILCRLFG
jgi:hypothetical protein